MATNPFITTAAPTTIVDPEAQALQRQKQYAAMLMQQNQQPQGQMIGNHYVAPSWTQQLNAALNPVVGAYMMNKADEQQQALSLKQQTAMQNNIAKALQTMKGTPGGMVQESATEANLPQGQTMVDDQGMPTLVPTMKQATPGNKELAIAQLLRPNASAVEQQLAGKVLEQQFREPSWTEVTKYNDKTNNTETYIMDKNAPNPENTLRFVGVSKPALSLHERLTLQDQGIGAGGGGNAIPSGVSTIAPGSPVIDKGAIQPPSGLSPKDRRAWFADQAKPLTGESAKIVSGAVNYQTALNNYYDAIKDLTSTDIANPQTRAKIQEKYNTVVLTGKNAHSLGVLNGGDEKILTGLVPNFNNPVAFKNTIKATVDGQKDFARSAVESEYAVHQKSVPANLRSQFGQKEEKPKINLPTPNAPKPSASKLQKPSFVDATTWQFMTDEEKALFSGKK